MQATNDDLDVQDKDEMILVRRLDPAINVEFPYYLGNNDQMGWILSRAELEDLCDRIITILAENRGQDRG